MKEKDGRKTCRAIVYSDFFETKYKATGSSFFFEVFFLNVFFAKK